MPISTGLNKSTISVGIILPEDNIKAIVLQWVHDLGVKCDVDNLSCRKTIIDVHQDSLHVDGKPFDGIFHISSSDKLREIKPKLGIKITPVIAGRGFHWQKRIDAIFPGFLEIKIQNGNLMVINELSIESYVACVATSEMGAKAPINLLAAQTIVARCWALAFIEKKHIDLGFDVCNDDCCQRYQGTTYLTEYSLNAAIMTENEVVVFNNEVIDARYSKNCGAVSEAADKVWDIEPIPYLIVQNDRRKQTKNNDESFDDILLINDAYCASSRFENINLSTMLGHVDKSNEYYRWTAHCLKSDILDAINNDFSLGWDKLLNFNILNRGKSGRITKLELVCESNAVRQTFVLHSEYDIRKYLHTSFLYSSAFKLKNKDTVLNDDAFILEGAGWGHGVGLCQMGALGMALDGIHYHDILLHYFPNTAITKLNL
jgi:stage II sporulation protein D